MNGDFPIMHYKFFVIAVIAKMNKTKLAKYPHPKLYIEQIEA